MAAVSGYTWDGLPIAPDEPHGAAILVRRPGEYLILHRAHQGSGYDGDWAWTPPSGSRLPDEPVLTGALRELAEETGLHAGPEDLLALDLRGRWAHFRLDVPADAHPRVDAEHDRFEWLPPASAIARCRPAAVADGIRLAESAITAELAFRPSAEADLRRIAGGGPVRVHIALAGGRDAGFFQHYRVTGDYALAVGLPDTVGIDYVIGDPGLTGRGLGSQLIWSYLRDVVLPSHPDARHVVASPDVTNVRSIRALQKAGFAPAGEIAAPGEPGAHRLCVLDVPKFFGQQARRA